MSSNARVLHHPNPSTDLEFYAPVCHPCTWRALQVLQTFQKARELGLTVLRMWAFADGPDEWNALQPELEVLDDRVLRRA